MIAVAPYLQVCLPEFWLSMVHHSLKTLNGNFQKGTTPTFSIAQMF